MVFKVYICSAWFLDIRIYQLAFISYFNREATSAKAVDDLLAYVAYSCKQLLTNVPALSCMYPI